MFSLLHDEISAVRVTDSLKDEEGLILKKCFRLFTILASVGSAVHQMVHSNVFFYILLGLHSTEEVKVGGSPQV